MRWDRRAAASSASVLRPMLLWFSFPDPSELALEGAGLSGLPVYPRRV